MATRISPVPDGDRGEATAEILDDVFPVPVQLIGGPGAKFLLKVSDDAMAPKVADGDWVIVREQPDAEDNDIVAAMHDGDAVVRVLRRADGRSYLVALNQEAGAADISGDDVTILGVAVASFHLV